MTASQLLTMLESGNKNRTQHPTDANAESSRSHAVFQVMLMMLLLHLAWLLFRLCVTLNLLLSMNMHGRPLPMNMHVHSRPLCFTHVLSFPLVWNVTLGGEKRELDWTFSNTQKWVSIENGTSKVWEFPPCKMWASKNAHFQVFLRQHHKLSANIFGTKCTLDRGENIRTVNGPPTFPQNLVIFYLQMAEITLLILLILQFPHGT